MQLNYNKTGQGPAVFLIHGLFGSLSNFGLLHKHLQTDHTVVSVDVRNHGESPHCDSMSYAEMANDIIQLAARLGFKRFSLVGHSMGGKIAMATAMQAPQYIDKLIIADMAPVTYPSRHQGVFTALNKVPVPGINSRNEANMILAQGIEEVGVQQFLLKSLYRSEAGFQWRFNLHGLMQQYDIISQWPFSDESYQGPTLFIKGERSDYLITEYTDTVIRQFPNARMKIINNTGHWLHAEKPAIFNKLVSDFL
ncbi:alpha/beta fold hydrolase [Motilimonas pumila]|uniref:Alpha/beta fold hydrolase n=1 Tax=Motilimonas pumila TaxID=2303987 RepID=A0A418YEY1_9GAMM|nr:alpha/beta fold hydrolase [Motilimonas pumila]RJG47713.1 alpha/beta fold hydrolase [Motilimonas pumila]